MPHKNATKGATWERYCAKVLGLKRTLMKGRHDDRGDLLDPDITYECKDDGSRSPMQWWLQAEAARRLDGKPWAIVLSKVRLPRPGQPRGWAQMDIEQWKVMREYIRRLELAYEQDTNYLGDPVALRRRVFEDIGEGMAVNPLPLSQRQAS